MREYKLKSKNSYELYYSRKIGKKTAIPYKEIDFHYSDWVFLLTGLVFFGIVLGVTLLYFAFIKQ